jgi:predicted  nucleic acid-binding Zn-ribbon protein
MNKHLALLLELEDLTLTRKGLELTGSHGDQAQRNYLDQRIAKLRRQVPGELLSRYDRLTQQYPDPLAPVVAKVCQGCHEAVSARLAAAVERSNQLEQCENCGRFLYAQGQAPDYLSVS